MADERIYTIPLRKEFHKVPIYRRAEKAVKATREFLQHHMKSDVVKLGEYLNEFLHSQGRKNPPYNVQVKAWREKLKLKDHEIELVKAELLNAPSERAEVKKETPEPKPEIKPEDKKELETKLETQEQEKKKVLTQPQEKKKESKKPKSPKEKIPPQEEKLERTKQTYTKSQKPTHEKKK